MAKAKLTKRTIDALPIPERDTFVWDTQLAGFGVRIKPSGIISYVVQYRNTGHRSRRITLGRYGVTTPEEARKSALRLIAEIQAGNDPAATRHSNRHAENIAILADRYLTHHVEIHNAPSTQKQARRIVEKHLKPRIGSLKVKDLTRQNAMKLHFALRNTPREANNVLSVLSKMMSLAEAWGIRADNTNPCRRIKRYPENVRDRFFSDEELNRLGRALDRMEQDGTIVRDAIQAIRLLTYSGCRLGEVLGLQWDHVDFENAALYLPVAKTGARYHQVGAIALSVLANHPRVDGSPYIFHGRDGISRLTVAAMQFSWRHVREAAELTDARMHDLRHTVGTYSGQAGANAFLVRDKLGHKTLAMTGRYVSRDASPLRELSDMVEKRIKAALTAPEASESVNNVTSFRRMGYGGKISTG